MQSWTAAWINGLNGFREALQPDDTSDKYVLHAAVFEFGDDLQPELGALGLGNRIAVSSPKCRLFPCITVMSGAHLPPAVGAICDVQHRQ